MSDEPELRRDPVTGRWVLIAPERARRPISLPGHEPRARTSGERKPCPFCPGQESDTPDEVFAFRAPGTAPNGPGWRLRVVPNKFPAVKRPAPLPEGKSERSWPSPLAGEGGGASPTGEGYLSGGSDASPFTRSLRSPPSPARGEGQTEDAPFPSGRGAGGVGLFDTAPAVGFAEVLIDCPEHIDDPTRLSDEQFADVFRAYRERMTALAADPRLAHVAVFKNVGAEAGASLGHTHSQLVATPVVPALVEAEMVGAEAYFARTGRCVFCDIVERELADGARVVARSANFAIVTAFAPRFAYEMWVLPVRHEARYESLTDAAARELAVLLKRALRALDAVLRAPAYNWFLHTTPLRGGEPAHYHWHLEILPRTARPAGLEWGFGCHITAVAPERAASELRATLGPSE